MNVQTLDAVPPAAENFKKVIKLIDQQLFRWPLKLREARSCERWSAVIIGEGAGTVQLEGTGAGLKMRTRHPLEIVLEKVNYWKTKCSLIKFQSKNNCTMSSHHCYN